MKFLDDDIGMRDADSGDEVGISTQQIEQELAFVWTKYKQGVIGCQ